MSTFNTQGQALNFYEDTAKINAFVENFEGRNPPKPILKRKNPFISKNPFKKQKIEFRKQEMELFFLLKDF